MSIDDRVNVLIPLTHLKTMEIYVMMIGVMVTLIGTIEQFMRYSEV